MTEKLSTSLMGRRFSQGAVGTRGYHHILWEQGYRDEHQRTQTSLEKLSETSSTQNKENGDEKRGKKTEIKRYTTWAKIKKGQDERGKEHRSWQVAYKASALLRHQNLAPWNQSKCLN
jgi:hypothetical protein